MKSRLRHLVALLLIASCCRATSVVVIVTPQTIFIGADGKSTDSDNPKASGRTNKTTIFQNRLIVATLAAGNIDITVKGAVVFRYDFAKWIAEIEKKAPPNVSVTDLTRLLEQESRVTFKDMDGYISSGAFGNDHTHINFVDYVIAGFEAGIPIVNGLEYKINWQTLHLEGPVTRQLFSKADSGDNFNFQIVGANVIDYDGLRRKQGKSYEELVALIPKELDKVVTKQNLTSDEIKIFCLALLRVEAKHLSGVGPPYIITTTVPLGTGKPLIVYRGN